MSIELSTPQGADIVIGLMHRGITAWMAPVDKTGWRILVEGVPVVTITTVDGPFLFDAATPADWVATDTRGHELYRGHDVDELTAALRQAWSAEARHEVPVRTEFRLIAVRAGANQKTCPCGAPVREWRESDPEGDSEPHAECTNLTCNRSSY